MSKYSFTGTQLIQKVRDIAAGNPDFIYSIPEEEGGDTCMYWHTGSNSPGCIMGHALTELGVDKNDIGEGDNIIAVLEGILGKDHHLVDLVNRKQQEWLQKVQKEQDTGTHTWSEAVRFTDEYMKQFGVEV